ncbi:MAG: TolC family protein [Colwellia sp.]|nr:TolC family protein [Colwellia sp.]
MSFKFNRWKSIPIPLLTIFIVSGCSIAPKPWEKNEIKDASKQELVALDRTEEITKEISLDEAIHRGVKYNRQKRVRMMESALAEKQFDLMKFDMLPTLAANAGYATRNNYAASASTVFEDGKPAILSGNPTYSVSQAKKQATADITFSWNVLDFGLSYVKAKQQSDRFLISKEGERKVLFNITQEIRRAYYQAVTAEELLKRIHPLMKEVRIALQDSDKVKSLRLKSPIHALTYQRELLDVLRDLASLEKTLIFSKLELAELMGLKPGTAFELADKVQSSYELLTVPFNISTMEKIALENRPEILEGRYKERISQEELSVVMLSMLPGLSLNAGYNSNDSDYLLNNDWYSLGANVTWNLFNVFKYSPLSDAADAKIILAKERKLAIALAVITQVHLSTVRYQQAVGEYKLSKDYLNISQGIYEQAMNANELDMNSDLLIIKEKLSYLLATLRHSAAYANMQNSYGRIYASMGINKDSDVEYPKDNISEQKNETFLAEPIREETVVDETTVQEQQQSQETNAELLPHEELAEPLTALAILDDINTKDLNYAYILIKVGEILNITGKEYIVQQGDTLFELSVSFNEKMAEIIKNNSWLIEQNRITYNR